MIESEISTRLLIIIIRFFAAGKVSIIQPFLSAMATVYQLAMPDLLIMISKGNKTASLL